MVVKLCCSKKFNLLEKLKTLFSNSFFIGTIISAAAVGVDARRSLTKSIIGLSVSCPMAEIIGMLELKTSLANSSSLNAIKSSGLPPPLAIIITSGLSLNEILL